MSRSVIVLEDDPFTLATVAAALRQTDIDVVAEVADAASAIRLSGLRQPDAAVLDLDLGPGPTGIDAAWAIRRQLPHVGIVLLTSYHDPRLMRANMPTLPPGTQYIVKSELNSISALVNAINVAIEKAQLVDVVTSPDAFDLTDTQIETLRLVALGYTNAEIAKKRFVTEKTVEQAIARIIRHLDLVTSPELNQRVALTRAYYRLIGKEHRDE